MVFSLDYHNLAILGTLRQSDERVNHDDNRSTEAVDMLSRLAQTPTARIFLLVDALDECEPQDRLGDLADVII